MMLLPFVFMVHEYEEIIMFRRWIDRNREELKKRYPKIESFFTQRGTFDYSTSTFAVGTAHEFILISVVSFCSVWTGEYQWWFAALTGYSVHLLIHIAQWIVYQKYVPVIITSLLTLPLCLCRICKVFYSISFADVFMGGNRHRSYHTKLVFCILLYGQGSTLGKEK